MKCFDRVEEENQDSLKLWVKALIQVTFRLNFAKNKEEILGNSYDSYAQQHLPMLQSLTIGTSICDYLKTGLLSI